MMSEKQLDEIANNLAHYRGTLWRVNITGDLSDRLVGDYHEMLVSTMLARDVLQCACGCDDEGDAPDTAISA